MEDDLIPFRSVKELQVEKEKLTPTSAFHQLPGLE